MRESSTPSSPSPRHDYWKIRLFANAQRRGTFRVVLELLHLHLIIYNFAFVSHDVE